MAFLDARWRFGLKLATLACGVLLVVLLFDLTKEVFLSLPPAAPKTATTETPAAKDEPFRFFVETAVAQNGRGTVLWRLQSVAGSKLNLEFPLKLTLAPGPELTLPQTTYTNADFSPRTEKEMVVSVPYTLKGAARLDYTLRFGVCLQKNGQTASCMMFTRQGALPLTP